MAAAGEKEKKGWIDWRVFWTVLVVVIVVIPLLAFVAQRLISPGSGHQTQTQTVSTTSTLP